MSWAVTVRPQAQADLQHAYDWYDNRSAGLGDEFLADLADALMRLEADPERYPVYYRGFRRVLARRFPYKAFFRITGDAIIVVRVLHGAQDHSRGLRL